MIDIVTDEAVNDIVDQDRTVALRRQLLKLDGDEPLAVERTFALGARRGIVLLIHGFAQNRYTWAISGRSFVAALAEAGFEVWNLELRGHGRSREFGSANATAFVDYVDDARRVVAACDEPPFVIGHSLGGAVGVGVSTEMPLAGLVHLAGIYTFARHNAALRLLGRFTLEWEPVMRASRLRVSTGAAGRILGRLYSITEVAGYAFPISGWVPESIERPLLEERLALGFDWTSVEVWLQMARWAQGEPFAYRGAFAESTTPLLVAYGDHDALVKRVDAEACFIDSGSEDKLLLPFDSFHHQVHWGHIDLILGKVAPQEVWPRLIEWLRDRT